MFVCLFVLLLLLLCFVLFFVFVVVVFFVDFFLGGRGGGGCACDRLATVQAVTFPPQVKVMVEEGYGITLGDYTDKAEGQWKLRTKRTSERQRRKWTGKRNRELSVRDSKAGGKAVSSGPGPPRVISHGWHVWL